MKRLTVRIDRGVFYVKDNAVLCNAQLSGNDISCILHRLANYEDEAEWKEKGCTVCNSKSCIICQADECTNCLNTDDYEPPAFCPYCGKDLRNGNKTGRTADEI